MHAKPPTLVEYYKSFKEVCGIAATAVTALPLISALLPAAPSAYSFPPLGDVAMPARIGAVVLAVAMTYACFYSVTPANITRKFMRIISVSLLALFCYLLCFQHFVRKIDVPASDSAIFVSVGYQRTAFANQTFGSEGDWDMLRARGTSEEEVSKLWTARSLDLARFFLFASYCGFLLPLVSVLSLGVRYQM